MAELALDQAHEWVSFDDPDENRTWVFDVTFLLSHWGCIFGRGCQGVLTGPTPELVQGCCSYGAHFVDAADRRRVERAAKTLAPEEWQFRRQGLARGVTKTNAKGESMTRLVEGACIFLNRPGFANGPGCALHQAAMARGVAPLALKPDVCWQLPLHRDEEDHEDGHVTSTIRQWDRRHWGTGGEDFHWWCTEAPEAFTEGEPVYRTLRDELIAMSSRAAYDMLAAYLDEKRAGATPPLRHPAERPVALVKKRK